MRARGSGSALGVLLGVVLLVVCVLAGCSPGPEGAVGGVAGDVSPTSTTASPAPGAAEAPAGTAAATPSTTGAAAPAAPVLTWKDCGSKQQCATLVVPLDHANPGGATFDVAVGRVRATGAASKRIGSIVVNPGGPGASGLEILSYLARRLPSPIRERFDVVTFDPRGVGSSGQVHCLSGNAMHDYLAADPTPDDQAEVDRLVALSKLLAEGCQRRNGDLLAHVGTLDVARDMDLLRAALGDEKLTYVGYSYGTYLGAAYAELFPDRVRALVLDGPVDPTEDQLAGGLSQGRGFETAFTAFSADCAAKASCAWKPEGGASVTAALRLVARVDASPLPASDGRPLESGELFYGLAYPLYDKGSWPTLAAALAAAEKGQGRPLQVMADEFTGRQANGSYDGTFEALAVVSCRDRPGPRDVATIAAAAQEAAKTAPLFGPTLAWGALGCSVWPVPAERPAAAFTAPKAPPILVVATTRDPATPFENAKALSSQLTSGILVTHDGDGHTAYGDSCVDSTVNAYLLTLKAPGPGFTCRS